MVTRDRSCDATSPRARQGLHVLHRPRDRVLLLRESRAPEPLDNAGYFDLTTVDVGSNLRRRTLHMLESMGIPGRVLVPRGRASQHEIDLRYTETLDMADNIMTLRLVVRKIALDAGIHATFMPKPLDDGQGSGMHTHMSLFAGEDNAFHDEDDELGLSDTPDSSWPECCTTPPSSPRSPTSW